MNSIFIDLSNVDEQGYIKIDTPRQVPFIPVGSLYENWNPDTNSGKQSKSISYLTSDVIKGIANPYLSGTKLYVPDWYRNAYLLIILFD